MHLGFISLNGMAVPYQTTDCALSLPTAVNQEEGFNEAPEISRATIVDSISCIVMFVTPYGFTRLATGCSKRGKCCMEQRNCSLFTRDCFLQSFISSHTRAKTSSLLRYGCWGEPCACILWYRETREGERLEIYRRHQPLQ